MYHAKVLADSMSPDGHRLTTMQITYPRFVHAEFMTHRMFSRNAASSRGIPISRMIQAVLVDPVIPVQWGKNRAGMQATDELTNRQKRKAEMLWLSARDKAVVSARMLEDLSLNDPDAAEEDLHVGVHKQVTNRLLEPWMWITVIVSATEWDNFFHLRCHPDAQPEIRHIAEMMRDVLEYSASDNLWYERYHLPLVHQQDIEEVLRRTKGDSFAYTQQLKEVSAGRCARVSYLTHEGKRDIQADIDLCHSLISNGHWSPLEHVATPQLPMLPQNSNFKGWWQFRKEFDNENYNHTMEMT